MQGQKGAAHPKKRRPNKSMTPQPYTLLWDARMLANQAARLVKEQRELKDWPASAAHTRGLIFGLLLGAKQFVHANKMQRHYTYSKD